MGLVGFETAIGVLKTGEWGGIGLENECMGVLRLETVVGVSRTGFGGVMGLENGCLSVENGWVGGYRT
jgi:hypothetical protein